MHEPSLCSHRVISKRRWPNLLLSAFLLLIHGIDFIYWWHIIHHLLFALCGAACLASLGVYRNRTRFTRGLYFIFLFQTVSISLMFGSIPLMLYDLFSREVKSYVHMVCLLLSKMSSVLWFEQSVTWGLYFLHFISCRHFFEVWRDSFDVIWLIFERGLF